jgi:hypothetical protein
MEACRFQTHLKHWYHCQSFSHIWLSCSKPSRCLRCGCGHCHRECLEINKEGPATARSSTPAATAGGAKQELQRRKEHRGLRCPPEAAVRPNPSRQSGNSNCRTGSNQETLVHKDQDGRTLGSGSSKRSSLITTAQQKAEDEDDRYEGCQWTCPEKVKARLRCACSTLCTY